MRTVENGAVAREPQPSALARRYPPIESHGVIGDLHTVALVRTDGTIDWYCLPHFDSPSLFAAILDADRGGYFRIGPTCEVAQRKQMYFPDTNVLLTRFLSEAGVGEVVDFMPVEADEPEEAHFHQIYRTVKVVRGTLPFRLECMPAFDYGREPHEVSIVARGALFASPRTTVALHSPIALEATDGGATASFTLTAGESVTFVLKQVEAGSTNEVLDPSLSGDTAFPPVHLRDHARLRQPPRPLRRADRPDRPGARQLPAGLHAPGAHQRGLQPRSRAQRARLARWWAVLPILRAGCPRARLVVY